MAARSATVTAVLWSSDFKRSTATWWTQTPRPAARHDRRGAGGDVVRAAQHLDREDAGVREPSRYRGGRRAALRGIPDADRYRPSGARRGRRLAADRPLCGNRRALGATSV